MAVILTACSSLVGETPTETIQTQTAADAPTTTMRSCPVTTGRTTPIDTGSPATDALFLSGEMFVCSHDVVVVGQSDLNEIAAAAQLAAALEGPLLLPDARLAAEIGRLKPKRVHFVGAVQAPTPPDAEILTHDISTAAETAASELGAPIQAILPATPDASTVVETVLAINDRDRVVTPPATTSTRVTTLEPIIATDQVIEGLAQESSAEIVWVVDAAEPITTLLAAASGKTARAQVVAIDATDLLGYPEVSDAFAGRELDQLRFLGPSPDASDWELSLLVSGEQVPGGGFFILPPDQRRRYVAFYGHPETTALGALGEQGPEETLRRMQPFLDAYEADGSQTIPTFEMIASVASAGPTEDGDYSFEWPIETFDDWVETAGENDAYVVLDLQPGREDFLSQAMLYEDLLKLPFVGLALDPEWRLRPDQVHLQQVGRVEASEVNQVIHWLADLVRDNGLPQKMLIVHQFRTSMIQSRELLEQRPELQLIIQMDGDGSEAQKDNTYALLQQGAGDAFWRWGWKNFFDEDEPGPPTPESTMGKSPPPVYVSYQ